MKKALIFVFSTILSLSILGQTKVTISDGNYNDPNIWSPTGVPNLINTDSLYIAHNLTFNQKIIVNWDYFEIQSTACLSSISGLDTISFIDVNGSAQINGDLDVGWFNNQCALTIINGQVNAQTQFNNLDSIVINTSAIIETYKWYCASGVDYSGQLSCSYFNNNGGNIAGSGKICVSDTLRNQGNVGGTIDICDATPSGSGDYNIGTYGSNVTFCAGSPCVLTNINCTSTSIGDYPTTLLQLNIYPNPSQSLINVVGAEKMEEFIITDLSGKALIIGNLKNKQIDIESLSGGLYLLKLQRSGEVIRFVKNSF